MSGECGRPTNIMPRTRILSHCFENVFAVDVAVDIIRAELAADPAVALGDGLDLIGVDHVAATRCAVIDVQMLARTATVQQRQCQGHAYASDEANHRTAIGGVRLAGWHRDAHRNRREGRIVGIQQPHAQFAALDTAHGDTDRVAVFRLAHHRVSARHPRLVQPCLQHDMLRRQRLRIRRKTD